MTPLGRIAALAADRRVHRAFHWLHLHELRLRQWQLEMIAVPAPTFAEQERAAWFVERFRELGLADPRLDAEGNALASLGEGQRALLLSAHLDTVFPSTTNCTPVEDGARILAPGACDNAAGLTALLGLAAALQFAEIEPPVPILFAANTGEEGAGDLRGIRHIFATQPGIGAGIALEGSGVATVVDRALGSRRMRITVTGPGGHSWADAALPNPIFALAEVLSGLARLPLPGTPRTTLHCGTIQGGTSVNSIPESATADLDLRSVSPEALEDTERQALHLTRATIASLNARFPAGSQLQLQIARIGDRPAGELPANSFLARSLQAVDRHLNIATELRIGSTDANLPLSVGIPALAIGCGGVSGGIHTLQEWHDPTGRELALRRILLLILDTCEHLAAIHSTA